MELCAKAGVVVCCGRVINLTNGVTPDSSWQECFTFPPHADQSRARMVLSEWPHIYYCMRRESLK